MPAFHVTATSDMMAQAAATQVTPKAGRTLTIARAEVYGENRKHVATMQQTLMMLAGTADHRE